MDTDRKLQFQIEFENVDVAEAGRLAESLREYVLDADASVEAKRHRLSQDSMDFGAGLVVLLGTPAIVAVAKGIQSFLARYQTAEITMKGPNGSVIAKNLTGRQATDLAVKLQNAWPSPN